MIERLTRIVIHIIILLIVVQALTGVLLSMYYTPDSGAAEVRFGVPGTIHFGNTSLVRDGDTLAAVGQYALVPAKAGDVVPSGAASSVYLTIEHHVVGGSMLRYVHHANASALILVVMVLVVLLSIQRMWHTQRWLWWTSIVGLVVLLVSGYTGRLLPDDVYAYFSSHIVRHELREFPLGSAITSLLGLSASESARLSTPYAIHAILLPVFVTIGTCFLWRRYGNPSVASMLGCAAAIGLGALVSTSYYPIRDISNQTPPAGGIEPWWPFVVPNALVTWLGGELAGYLAMAGMLALITLPLWARRTR